MLVSVWLFIGKFLSGGFHGTSEFTTVSTLVHVYVIGMKKSGFLILSFVGEQTCFSYILKAESFMNKWTDDFTLNFSPTFIVSPHCSIKVFHVLNTLFW